MHWLLMGSCKRTIQVCCRYLELKRRGYKKQKRPETTGSPWIFSTWCIVNPWQLRIPGRHVQSEPPPWAKQREDAPLSDCLPPILHKRCEPWLHHLGQWESVYYNFLSGVLMHMKHWQDSFVLFTSHTVTWRCQWAGSVPEPLGPRVRGMVGSLPIRCIILYRFICMHVCGAMFYSTCSIVLYCYLIIICRFLYLFGVVFNFSSFVFCV